MGKGYQKGGYQEQRHKARAKARTEEKIVMIPVFKETLTLKGDTMLLPRQHQSMQLHSFYVLLFMSMHHRTDQGTTPTVGMFCLLFKALSWLLRHGKTLLHPTSLS